MLSAFRWYANYQFLVKKEAGLGKIRFFRKLFKNFKDYFFWKEQFFV